MVLSVRGVSKRYGALQALEDVSLEFKAGQVHAVLGENGAGKSTLMGVLAGFVRPDEGEVWLGKQALALGRPAQIAKLGIAMVHQHFMLVPAFSVAENLALTRLGDLRGTLKIGELTQPALQVARSLGWEIKPEAPLSTLPVGAQQRVEILKVLSTGARVLIFDEPTAVLAPEEITDLFRVLRQLGDQGDLVILIAHKLSEVMQVADHVSILRQGKLVASAPMQGLDERQLAEWMVGELPAPRSPLKSQHKAPVLLAETLQIRGDRGETAVRGVSLEVSPGEILGIGGVDGNGQVELAEALAGVRRFESGQLLWRGKPVNVGDLKIAYIPQDRQADGLALGMSIYDNLLIAGLDAPELYNGPFFSPRKIQAWAADLIQKFQIKIGSLRDPVSSLSGGNQQKVVVSRTLSPTPDLCIAVNPTRGLDIRAADFVQSQLLEAAQKGAAVVLFSTDLDELAALASRSLFMSRGQLSSSQSATSYVGGEA